MKRYLLILTLLNLVYIKTSAQAEHYQLDKMLTNGQLEINPGHKADVVSEDSKKGVTLTGIAWLKGTEFKTGTVELDIRGRNQFLKSFVGVVFNASDTARYENICFRPFNFRHQDSLRRTWSLAYTSEPDYPFFKLRKENAGQFEHEIIPNPKPEDWFHARIVIKKDSILVYVNGMGKPTLTVRRLGEYHGRRIGLWVFGNDTPGDFANLSVKKDD